MPNLGQLISNIFIDGLKNIAKFPVWWYGRGLRRVGRACLNGISDFNNSLGFTIWLKNITTPMFGQRDFWGRLISIGMRLIQIIARGLAMLIISLIFLGLFLVWLVLPIFLIWQIIIH